MALNMKVNEEIIKLTAKENFGILMEIFMKENELMIKLRVLEFINIKMVQDMKEIGRKIYKMGME